jgi:hypothetical protein
MAAVRRGITRILGEVAWKTAWEMGGILIRALQVAFVFQKRKTCTPRLCVSKTKNR